MSFGLNELELLIYIYIYIYSLLVSSFYTGASGLVVGHPSVSKIDFLLPRAS